MKDGHQRVLAAAWAASAVLDAAVVAAVAEQHDAGDRPAPLAIDHELQVVADQGLARRAATAAPPNRPAAICSCLVFRWRHRLGPAAAFTSARPTIASGLISGLRRLATAKMIAAAMSSVMHASSAHEVCSRRNRPRAGNQIDQSRHESDHQDDAGNARDQPRLGTASVPAAALRFAPSPDDASSRFALRGYDAISTGFSPSSNRDTTTSCCSRSFSISVPADSSCCDLLDAAGGGRDVARIRIAQAHALAGIDQQHGPRVLRPASARPASPG